MCLMQRGSHQIIRNFLIRDKRWHDFEQEIELSVPKEASAV